MGLDGRIYIDGGGTSRQMEVEVAVSGRDRWTSHDPTTHEKLDEVVEALAPSNPYLEGSVTDSVGSSLITIVTFDCRKWNRLGLMILNTGTIDLLEFKVAVKYNVSESFRVRLENPADYTSNTIAGSATPELMAIAASGDLTILPGGAEGWLELNVERVGFVAIQVAAQADSTDLVISSILKA